MEENEDNLGITKIKTKTKKKKEEEPMSDKARNVIFDCVAIICLIVMAIAVTPKTMQNDTYYNIKCGEYIFQNGIFDLTDDPFSWHDLSYTWPHWLFDLLIYLVYAAARCKLGICNLCNDNGFEHDFRIFAL